MRVRIAKTHLSSVLTFSRRRSVWIVFVYASRLLMSLLAIPPETQAVFRRKLIRQTYAGLCESEAEGRDVGSCLAIESRDGSAPPSPTYARLNSFSNSPSCSGGAADAYQCVRTSTLETQAAAHHTQRPGDSVFWRGCPELLACVVASLNSAKIPPPMQQSRVSQRRLL